MTTTQIINITEETERKESEPYAVRNKDKILKAIDEIATGSTLKEAAEIVELNHRMLQKCLYTIPEFNVVYRRARKVGTDAKVDTLLTIFDEERDVNRARGKSDNIKWLASKLNREQYGDKVDVNVNQTISIGSALDAAKLRTLSPIQHQTEVLEGEIVEESIGYDSEPSDKQSPVPPQDIDLSTILD